jgi:hypothetical protein
MFVMAINELEATSKLDDREMQCWVEGLVKAIIERRKQSAIKTFGCLFGEWP